MSSTAMKCSNCEGTTSSFFIVIGNEMICADWKKNDKEKISQFQRPRVFTRYICLTHSCKTYSVSNMYFRHWMNDCNIITQQTLGVIRPGTEGGVNGDISRKYFLDLNQMDRLMTNLENYIRTANIHRRLSKQFKYDSLKISYMDRKFYSKHQRFYVQNENPDYHKFDNIFSEIKFNLKVYIEKFANKG